jgi:hypothetical protein
VQTGLVPTAPFLRSYDAECIRRYGLEVPDHGDQAPTECQIEPHSCRNE